MGGGSPFRSVAFNMSTWINYLVDITMPVFVVLFLFEGTRRIALRGLHKKAIQLLASGFAVVLIVGGSAYFQSRLIKNTIDALKESTLTKHLPLPDNWSGECCKSTREKGSRALVASAFIESGKLYEHFDSTGNRILLIPSENEIAEREKLVLSKYQIEEVLDRRFWEAINILVSSIISILVGALIGKEQHKESKVQG